MKNQYEISTTEYELEAYRKALYRAIDDINVLHKVML